MIRRHTILLLPFVLLCIAPPTLAQTHDRPPNVVLIVADDLGWGELGSYGQKKIRTPNLDRLASEGQRFRRFYSGAPVCAPSRCMLMTGRHPGHAYIRDNKEVGRWGPEEPEGQWPLPADQITMAEVLQQRGYTTGAFGKWGLGGPGSEGHPCSQGFDHFYGYLCQRVAHNYYPTHLWRNHDVDVLHGNRHFAAHQKIAQPLANEAEYARYSGTDYASTEIANEALAFIREHKAEPFFLYYPSVIPHVALQAPQDFIDQYPRDWDDEHYLGQQGYLPTPRPNATYAAMITYLDHVVGQVLDLLDELGLADDTVVMFTSDNGATYAGGVDMKFFDSVAGLRGRKGDLYEGGIRVPMIARWPGRIDAGSVTDQPAAFWDLFPTIAAIAGAETPAGIDGVSLLPTLVEGAPLNRDVLYWEFPGYGGQQAVMFDRFKGVRRNMRKGNLAIELYDLHADPNETTDLASRLPAVVERMESLMRESHTPSKLFPLPGIDR